MTHRRQLLAALGASGILAAATPVRAQSAKSVRVVVPFAAGGVQDILARSISAELRAALLDAAA